MRRLLTGIVAAGLAVTMIVTPSVGASSGSARQDYRGDLVRSREAVARAAARFDRTVRFPEGAAKYFADFPISFAHPSPDPVSMVQPDGTRFAGRIRPMDIGGGVETWRTGHTILKDEQGWWVYAVPSGDRLVPSGARVGIDAVPAGLAPHLGTVPQTIWATPSDLPAIRSQLFAYFAARSRAMNEAAEEEGEPRVFKVPVLMLETFSEFEEASTPETFEQQLSGYGTNPTGTMTELYHEMSYGKVEIDVDVFGPYTSIPSQAYRCFYGTEGSAVLGDTPLIGGIGIGGGGAKGMAAEAVPQADPDVNFGDYDNDLDGVVDFLVLLHSGPDAAATGDGCHTWSHMFPPIFGEPAAVTSDENEDGHPVTIGNVMTIPEIDLEIGVAAHELMHALGEPDYYATNYLSSGTGDWDLGAGGAWYGDPPQSNPLHFNPMIKMNQGWAEPTLVQQTTLGARLRPRETHPDLLWVPIKLDKELDLCEQGAFGHENLTSVFLVGEGENALCAMEGFLIEQASRSAPGALFDRFALGSGLLIWHYDLSKWEQGGNNDFLRPMLDIEEFDRRDGTQDLQLNKTRGDPMDVFFGDPVGISAATAELGAEGGTPQQPLEWTVAGTPCACGSGTLLAAQPIQTFTVEDNPDNKVMGVSLGWRSDANDWDLDVDRKTADGAWEQVGTSSGLSNPEVVTIPFPIPGEYRVRAYNWASVEPTATVKVEFQSGGLPILQTANTFSNDLVNTGWSFTNIRPFAYDGLEVPFEHGDHTITLDLVKHTLSTSDLTPDFVRVTNGPLQAGRPADLATTVYEHGGWTVPEGSTIELRLGGPNGKLIGSGTLGRLPGFSAMEVSGTWTPSRAGAVTIWTRVAPPAGFPDDVPGNNVVATRLEVFPADARILIVDDDDGFGAEEAYAGALQSLGIPYAIAETTATAETMSRFEAVIWHNANARFEGSLSASDRNAIKQYLAGGGDIWVAGPNVARALDADDTRVGRVDPAFLHDYFGVVYVDSMQRGAGVAESSLRSYKLRTPYARTLMDYVELGSEEDETASTIGRATPAFFWPAIEGALVGSRLEGENFRTVLTTFDLPQVISGAKQAKLVREILEYLGVEPGDRSFGLVIRHASLRVTNPGQEQAVTAAVGGDPRKVLLSYRPHGAAGWTVAEMARVAPGVYSAVIPAGAVVRGGVDYFIQAVGRGLTVQHPRLAPDVPHYIAVRS